MTYLLPFLKILKRSDALIASRFYRIAQSIFKSSNSNPCVIAESCVFFEKLLTHLNLIDGDSIIITGTDEVVKPIFPLLLSILTSNKPRNSPNNNELKSSLCSATLQRAALNLLSKLTELPKTGQDGITCDLIKSSNLLGHLFALMENSCATKTFFHLSPFRSICAPRAIENKLRQNSSLDKEVESMIARLMFVTRTTGSLSKSNNFLRYLLITRNIFSGDLTKENVLSPTATGETNVTPVDEIDEESVVSKLYDECRNEASIVLMIGSSQPRWQVKCIAAKMFGKALSGIINEVNVPVSESVDFNLTKARRQFKEYTALRFATFPNEKSDENDFPYSKVVLHVGDLLTSTCNSIIATVDNSELPSLQNAGMKFLVLLLCCFGKSIDPDESKNAEGKSPLLLERFSSQIIPSIKHAAKAHDNSPEETISAEGKELLFFSGCEGLQTLINSGLISEPSMLRRIMRPMIPSKDELDTCKFPSVSELQIPLRFKPTSILENRRSALIYRIGKLWTIAELQLAFAVGNIAPESIVEVWEDLSICEEEVAVNSAAVAMDAMYIKKIENATLDINTTKNHTRESNSTTGITFADMEDIDQPVRDAMVQTRLSLAFSSIFSLVKILSQNDLNEEKKVKLEEWLRYLVPMIIVELQNYLNLFREITHDEAKLNEDYSSVIKNIIKCLCALTILSKYNEVQTVLAANDFETVFQSISDSILLPLLGISKGGNGVTRGDEEKQSEMFQMNRKLLNIAEMPTLASEACVFMECVSQLIVLGRPQKFRIIKTLLSHIACEEAGLISYEINGSMKNRIISSCLKSMKNLLFMELTETFHENNFRNLGRAMVGFSLSLMNSYVKGETSEEVKNAAAILLKTCLEKLTLQASEVGSLAEHATKNHNFEAWEMLILHMEEKSAMINSLENVKISLENGIYSSYHLAALNSLSQILQQSLTRGDSLVPFFMEKLGAQIVQLIRVYGNNQLQANGSGNDRTVLCATCIKIMMLSFQFMVQTIDPSRAVDCERESATFMAIIFEALVSVVLFNGLPNQNTSNQVGSDPQIGQLCAQTFVHIARSAPSVFKTSMAFLSVECRSTLETAVRTDMNGYAPPTRVKKKLNLRGFKKS